MNDRAKLRARSARVAATATVVVIACYLLCALGVRLLVAQRLTSDADTRIHGALAFAQSAPIDSSSTPALVPDRGEVDDAPVFVWYVARDGIARALTAGSPPLPRRTWETAPVTLPIGAGTFRLGSVRRGAGRIVAAQSIVEVARVDDALLLPEAGFGLVLAVVVFAGAFLVALRASAPLDLVRRRQAEFTADASHELRTPLSVLEAEVDLALRRPRRPEEYEVVLRRVGDEGRRLRRIVDDLLWLARVGDGHEPRSKEETSDVTAVAAACVERFEAVAQRGGTALDFVASGPGSGVVRVSPDLVDRLVGVLVDNACKYAGRGGAVSVFVERLAARVTLRVDDSGPGIPASERTAVLDRFHRATSSGPGSGLGLAIGDSIVRMTRGTWFIGESPLGGARLSVSWRSVQAGAHPACATAPSCDPVSRASSDAPQPTGPSSPSP